MGYYICTDCGNIYNSDLITNKYQDGYYCPCPNIKCNGRIFECDELMIPAIIELNQKGYDTQYCCSGHIWDYLGTGYISFYPEVFGTNESLPAPPKGWKWEDTIHCSQQNCTYRQVCLRSENEGKNDLAKYQNILTNIYNLTKWAKSLEVKEYDF